MVAMTKAQAKAAFEYVTNELLQFLDNNPVMKSFAKDGLNDVRNIFDMDYKQYELLTYIDGNGDELVISPWQYSLLKILRAYN